MKNKIKVIMPKWWHEEDKKVIGFTDCINTYCCSSSPSWYVSVPDLDYEGYFNIKDLILQNKEPTK